MEGERTYGCLHKVGHWIVRAYLQVESSVIELIIGLGSEHTNLTCDENLISVWLWKKGKKNTKVFGNSYFSLSWLICKVTWGTICILMSMVPAWTIYMLVSIYSIILYNEKHSFMEGTFEMHLVSEDPLM